jgi:hypothetical protein
MFINSLFTKEINAATDSFELRTTFIVQDDEFVLREWRKADDYMVYTDDEGRNLQVSHIELYSASYNIIGTDEGVTIAYQTNITPYEALYTEKNWFLTYTRKIPTETVKIDVMSDLRHPFPDFNGLGPDVGYELGGNIQPTTDPQVSTYTIGWSANTGGEFGIEASQTREIADLSISAPHDTGADVYHAIFNYNDGTFQYSCRK